MPATSAFFPFQDAIVDRDGKSTRVFADWVNSLVTDVDKAPESVGLPVSLNGLEATLGIAAIPTGALTAGLYRVSYVARITRAATTSSSLTVSLSWTVGGNVVTLTGAPITGNTLGTVQCGGGLIRIDEGSPITYAAVYASVGAVGMQYAIDVVLEEVSA
jgi:hypothetical protein